jgi:hypothetical protein
MAQHPSPDSTTWYLVHESVVFGMGVTVALAVAVVEVVVAVTLADAVEVADALVAMQTARKSSSARPT